MSENFQGTIVVERVISKLEHGCIFAGRQEDNTSIRVKFTGRDTQLLPGDAFLVKGLLSAYRDRYGKSVPQVDSKRMARVVNQGHLIGPWLERLPNIGETRAQRLINTFGHELANVLGDTRRMAEVAAALDAGKPALAAKIAAQLYAAIAAQAGSDKLKAAEVGFLIFLEKIGIKDSRVAGQLWRFMAGMDAVDRLRHNPYVPASLMDWKKADRVGQRLLRDGDTSGDLNKHPARLQGALNSVWRELLLQGDTAGTEERIRGLLEARGVESGETLRAAAENGSLRRLRGLLRVPGAAWLEDQITAALGAMEAHHQPASSQAGQELGAVVWAAEVASGLTLTDEQRAAVITLLVLPVAALQGGAGVGKTTVMKVLATAWEAMDGNVVFAALAGKAALTLSRGASNPQTPRLAYTVARLIGMLERQRAQESDPDVKRPVTDVTVNERTLLVIDEAGMLDTPSLHRLLKLLPTGARLLLAGDDGQLPPVGIGQVFHDVVADGRRVVTLTKILRQAADSEIPTVAALVRNGKIAGLSVWSEENQGVYLLPGSQLAFAQRRLRAQGELLVIAATRATVSSLNDSESNYAHSPGCRVRRLGPLATVAVGDPVVMTVNRYQDALFNGLLGVVTGIDEGQLLVHWDGEPCPREVPPEAEGDIELAFAITCHKAQGSSATAVIVVVEDSRLVTREWLYTGLTRGRELVLLVAEDIDLNAAVSRHTHRTTAFTVPACQL